MWGRLFRNGWMGVYLDAGLCVVGYCVSLRTRRSKERNTSGAYGACFYIYFLYFKVFI